jgi:hypothetical protein
VPDPTNFRLKILYLSFESNKIQKK